MLAGLEQTRGISEHFTKQIANPTSLTQLVESWNSHHSQSSGI